MVLIVYNAVYTLNLGIKSLEVSVTTKKDFTFTLVLVRILLIKSS